MQSDEERKAQRRKHYLKNREELKAKAIIYNQDYRVNNKESIKKSNNSYVNTENGFLHGSWASVKLRCKKHNRINEFKDFDEFNNHWLEQKSKYGMQCPATGVEMTTIRRLDVEKYTHCDTNISVDRILSTEGYTRKNIIFTSWKYNNAKGSFTPKMAEFYLKIVKERYGDTNETQ